MPDRRPPRAVARAGLALRTALLRAADAVVPPEFALFDHSLGLARTAMLAAVAELGVADELARAPRTAADLARARGLDADALHRVLRALAVLGVVRLDRAGRFRLTRLGRGLRSDRRLSVHPWVRYLALPSTRAAWAGLEGAIRTGRPPFSAVNGRTVWDHFAAHPDEEALFAEAMRNLSRWDLPFVVHGYPWPDDGTVCDVAGGVGTVLAAILRAHPGMSGILVDAAGVLRAAEDHLGPEGLRDRVELRAGDIFERIDADADVYVLKDVLHDWDDAACARILAAVRAAMRPGARLVVVERLQERDVPDPIASLADIQMLTQCEGGRQRSASDLHALLRGAGFVPGPVRETAGPALVEAIA